MRTLDIMFGLHFYQPPTQRAHVLKRIVEECYIPLCSLFEETELRNCVVVDMAAALMEQFSEQCPDIFSRLRLLHERGNISFANTAAYHPILPLVPKDYAKRQLQLNESAYRGYGLLAKNEILRGVFPPEMAVAPRLFVLLKQLGYSWTITDDTPFRVVNHVLDAPRDWIPAHRGVACFLRSRSLSNHISFDVPDGAQFAQNLWEGFQRMVGTDLEQAYVVIWMDAETFGHHHRDALKRFLSPFFASLSRFPITLQTPEELLRRYPMRPANIPAGSWSTDHGHIGAGIPYPLWRHPHIAWHRNWWKLACMALRIAKRHPQAQEMCDRALYSCQPWWYAVNQSAELFRWAIPYFHEIFQFGTAKQRAEGEGLIKQLQW